MEETRGSRMCASAKRRKKSLKKDPPSYRSDTLFQQWRPRKKHWKFFRDSTLSLLPWSYSVPFKVKKDGFEIREWKSLNLFESDFINDKRYSCALFTGGPIKSSAWCPIPLKKEQQYLALSVSFNENYVSYSCTHPRKGLIQLWNFGFLHTSKLFKKPEMELALHHNHGEVLDMAWCPVGCWEEPEKSHLGENLSRLGLLAVACSDSYIRIYSIPHPECMEKHNNLIFYSWSEVLLRPISTKKSACCCLSWENNDQCRRIAGGYSNGMIFVWMIDSKSTLLISSESNKIMNPYLAFQAYGIPVSNLSFAADLGGRVLVSYSLNRELKFWDLHDTRIAIINHKNGYSGDAKWAVHCTQTFPTIFIPKYRMKYLCFFDQLAGENSNKSTGLLIPTLTCSSSSESLHAIALGDYKGSVILNAAVSHLSKPLFKAFKLFDSDVENIDECDYKKLMLKERLESDWLKEDEKRTDVKPEKSAKEINYKCSKSVPQYVLYDVNASECLPAYFSKLFDRQCQKCDISKNLLKSSSVNISQEHFKMLSEKLRFKQCCISCEKTKSPVKLPEELAKSYNDKFQSSKNDTKRNRQKSKSLYLSQDLFKSFSGVKQTLRENNSTSMLQPNSKFCKRKRKENFKMKPKCYSHFAGKKEKHMKERLCYEIFYSFRNTVQECLEDIIDVCSLMNSILETIESEPSVLTFSKVMKTDDSCDVVDSFQNVIPVLDDDVLKTHFNDLLPSNYLVQTHISLTRYDDIEHAHDVINIYDHNVSQSQTYIDQTYTNVMNQATDYNIKIKNVIKQTNNINLAPFHSILEGDMHLTQSKNNVQNDVISVREENIPLSANDSKINNFSNVPSNNYFTLKDVQPQKNVEDDKQSSSYSETSTTPGSDLNRSKCSSYCEFFEQMKLNETRTYCGLVFKDFSLKYQDESTFILSKEDCFINDPVLSAINTVALNPNKGNQHWLFSAGHSGLARLHSLHKMFTVQSKKRQTKRKRV